ncbi:NUMOD4 domain-containing protein [Tautonia plasticadhaerens]|uniref:NUMOD4 domain-containing protein n=1 Tax=Tautonia plasticadhaerens TaxID=2527974 RepID=UPI0011A7F123|nr:NUMOD4 domain-containing protein [Tautonia plasticadhaerens]
MSECKEVASEEWRPVLGHEGRYEVSNRGNVRSLLNRYGNPRVKVLAKNRCGRYERVTLCKNGTKVTAQVHRLVATAFLELIEGKNYVNHIDGQPFNNDLANLEWVTPAENIIHAADIGLRRTGDDVPWTKLSEADIPRIREKLAQGVSIGSLAIEHGVATSTIFDIKRGKSWRRVA